MRADVNHIHKYPMAINTGDSQWETNLILEQPAYKTATFGFMWNMLRNPLMR